MRVIKADFLMTIRDLKIDGYDVVVHGFIGLAQCLEISKVIVNGTTIYICYEAVKDLDFKECNSRLELVKYIYQVIGNDISNLAEKIIEKTIAQFEDLADVQSDDRIHTAIYALYSIKKMFTKQSFWEKFLATELSQEQIKWLDENWAAIAVIGAEEPLSTVEQKFGGYKDIIVSSLRESVGCKE